MLPATDGRGRPWRGRRQVINGILWRLRTGAPWRDIPERYGPRRTCYERFKRWDQGGTWARLPEEMQVKDDSGDYLRLCNSNSDKVLGVENIGTAE